MARTGPKGTTSRGDVVPSTTVDGEEAVAGSPRASHRAPMQSVERVSAILLAFSKDGPLLKLTDIARRLDLPKSAVHRILDSLVQTGFVMREPESARYRLGPQAVELGMAAIGAPDVATIADPLMRWLTTEMQETTTLSLRVGWERFYAAQIESNQNVRMTVEIGRRWPLYAGASGRAILSALPPAELDYYLETVDLVPLTRGTIIGKERLRAELVGDCGRGYASSSGERDPSAAAVAAPIKGQSGRVIGSLSICGPITRFDPDSITRYGSLVVTATGELTKRLP